MDLNRVQELEEALLAGVRAQNRSNTICVFDPEIESILRSRILFVGRYGCLVTLRPVIGKPDKHTLRLRSEHAPLKVFRQTKAGWFELDNVVRHVLEVVAYEATTSRSQRARRLHMLASHFEVQRLAARFQEVQTGDLELLRSNDRPGTIDLVIHGLRERDIIRIVHALRDMSILVPKNEPAMSIWQHLKGD